MVLNYRYGGQRLCAITIGRNRNYAVEVITKEVVSMPRDIPLWRWDDLTERRHSRPVEEPQSQQLDLFADNRRTIWLNQAHEALRCLDLVAAMAQYGKIIEAVDYLRYAEFLRSSHRDDQELIRARRRMKEINGEMFGRYMKKIRGG